MVSVGLERLLDKPWHICASNANTGEGLQVGLTPIKFSSLNFYIFRKELSGWRGRLRKGWKEKDDFFHELKIFHSSLCSVRPYCLSLWLFCSHCVPRIQIVLEIYINTMFHGIFIFQLLQVISKHSKIRSFRCIQSQSDEENKVLSPNNYDKKSNPIL